MNSCEEHSLGHGLNGTYTPHMFGIYCNSNLGLVTKVRGCKVAGLEKDPGLTSHAPESAKECEGMNPHTPK